MFKYQFRQGWPPILASIGSLALYVCFIVACVAVAALAAANIARVGGTALQHAAHKEWDAPQKHARVSRSQVLDDDAWGFGYFKTERAAPEPRAAKKPLEGTRSGLIKQQPAEVSPWGFWGSWQQPEPPQPVSRPTYRTMCVRLCDGAYFPVSFATPSDRFARDEDICQKSCSSPAKLYVYRNPGGEVEQMHDVKGEPYTKLKTAFLFRTTYDASCTCKPNPWEEAAQQKHRMYAELEAKKKSKRAETGKRKQAARKSEPAAVTAGAPAAVAPLAAATTSANAASSTTAAPEVQKPEAPKVTVISSAVTDANEAAASAAKKATKRRTAAKGAMVAGWSQPAEPAAKDGKSRGASRKFARVYNGSDWRINVFQAN